MANAVKMFRMYNGGVLIGEVECESDRSVTLLNPRTVAPQMTMQGYALALGEILPQKVLVTKPVSRIEISLDQVMVVVEECDIVKAIVDEYRSDVSGIDIVSGVNADIFKKDPPKGGGIII